MKPLGIFPTISQPKLFPSQIATDAKKWPQFVIGPLRGQSFQICRWRCGARRRSMLQCGKEGEKERSRPWARQKESTMNTGSKLRRWFLLLLRCRDAESVWLMGLYGWPRPSEGLFGLNKENPAQVDFCICDSKVSYPEKGLKNPVLVTDGWLDSIWTINQLLSSYCPMSVQQLSKLCPSTGSIQILSRCCQVPVHWNGLCPVPIMLLSHNCPVKL